LCHCYRVTFTLARHFERFPVRRVYYGDATAIVWAKVFRDSTGVLFAPKSLDAIEYFLQGTGYYMMPAEDEEKPLLMLNSHPALARLPDSRKYPESLLKQHAYHGQVADLAKSGLSERACRSQEKLLASTRDWVPL
jgi:hypothetical protein